MDTKITLNTKKLAPKKMTQTAFIRAMDRHNISRNTAVKIWHGGTARLEYVVAASMVLECGLDELVQVGK